MTAHLIRYWLCCGSKDPDHCNERAKHCIEGQLGFQQRKRWGTAEEHSAWQKTIAKYDRRNK